MKSPFADSAPPIGQGFTIPARGGIRHRRAMTNEPFFSRDGEHYIPNRVSAGPWNPDALHGRVVIGLLAHAIETSFGGPDYVAARLTVDMYRLPDFSPMTLETRAVRDGYRIKVVDAEVFSGGVSAGRATCQLLRRTENPAGRVWTPPTWDAPLPQDVPPQPDNNLSLNGMWTIRPVVGTMGTIGKRQAWMAEVRELIGGAPLTPLTRVALAADFASPFANAGDAGLGYINSDVTLYQHREMVGEWVGFEVVNHGATDGVGIGECWMYDTAGPLGVVTVCALAQKRMV